MQKGVREQGSRLANISMKLKEAEEAQAMLGRGTG